MCFKGRGSTFPEALDDYLSKAGMKDAPEVGDLRSLLQPSTVVSPLYIGINLDHTVSETLQYLDLFNALNSRYLSELLPLLEKTHLDSQSFSAPSGFKVAAGGDSAASGPEVPSVPVVDGAEGIALLDHFHVTLYFLGVDKKPDELVREDVERVSAYLRDANPDFELMLRTLTLYEFAVCLMFRRLYKMPLPFENPPSAPTEARGPPELATVRYLVLVPGVVFFAIVELDKPLFAIPPKDFDAGAQGAGGHAKPLERLLSCLRGKVLVESYHSTHVTLGTSRDYKAVISNQMCQALLHFLEAGEGRVLTLSALKAAPKGELRKHLRVFNSGPCKYANLKQAFVNALPLLLSDLGGGEDPDEDVELAEAPEQARPCGLAAPGDLYADTTVYVSDDYRWFYFRRLPASHTLHSETSRERYDWVVDAYVVALDKQLRGSMHFNQK